VLGWLLGKRLAMTDGIEIHERSGEGLAGVVEVRRRGTLSPRVCMPSRRLLPRSMRDAHLSHHAASSLPVLLYRTQQEAAAQVKAATREVQVLEARLSKALLELRRNEGRADVAETDLRDMQAW
jgi:hypothetical protein